MATVDVNRCPHIHVIDAGHRVNQILAGTKWEFGDLQSQALRTVINLAVLIPPDDAARDAVYRLDEEFSPVSVIVSWGAVPYDLKLPRLRSVPRD